MHRTLLLAMLYILLLHTAHPTPPLSTAAVLLYHRHVRSGFESVMPYVRQYKDGLIFHVYIQTVLTFPDSGTFFVLVRHVSDVPITVNRP